MKSSTGLSGNQAKYVLCKKNESGRIIRSVGMVQDITERKRAEDQIRSLAKFPLENPNPIVRVDKAGKIMYNNPAGIQLLKTWGCKAGEHVPDSVLKFITSALTSSRSVEFEETYGEQTLSF